MRLLTVMLVVVVAAAGHATTASAAWREQRLASGSAVGIDPPALAADARGDTAVAWSAGARAYVALRRAGAARFGRGIALGRGRSPRVAVLSDGSVLVVTVRGDGTTRGRSPCCLAAYVQRLRPRSRHLTAPRVVTLRGAALLGLDLSLTAGPGGRAALIGEGDGITVVASRHDGVFGEPAFPSLGVLGSSPFVGFGGDGRGVALWVEGFNDAQSVRGATIDRDGAVGAARTVVPTPDAATTFAFNELHAGLDRRDRLTALWLDFGAATPGARVATGSLDGSLGAPQVLDANPGIGHGLNAAQLAVAPNGRALAAWRRYGVAEQVVLATRRSAGARFRVLPALASRGDGPRIALLPSGVGVIVNRSGAQPMARVVRSDGRLAAGHGLHGIQLTQAVGTIAAAGRITVAWGTAAGLRTATYMAR